MAEYIEREVLLARLQENFNNRCNHDLLCKYVIDKIMTFPAADVEPVRHGEWEHNDNYVLWAERYICSKCGRNAQSDGNYRHDLTAYCPNCGAKMDGGAGPDAKHRTEI